MNDGYCAHLSEVFENLGNKVRITCTRQSPGQVVAEVEKKASHTHYVGALRQAARNTTKSDSEKHPKPPSYWRPRTGSDEDTNF